MDTPGSFRKFLWVFGLAALGFGTVAAGLNVAVDPYGVFGTPLIPSFNEVKARAGQQRELFKLRGATKTHPGVLILGNSRAEVGFDPESEAWPASEGPVYNLALAGLGLRAAARMLAEVSAVSKPRLVVLGVDFPDFLNPPGRVPSALITLNDYQPSGVTATEVATSLFSADTLLNSLQTVAAQGDPFSERLTARGFNPLEEYQLLVKREGFASLFAQKNAEYRARFAGKALTLYPQQEGQSPDAEQLAEISRFCRERGIELKLVIYPYHAQLMDIIADADLWDEYEEWKRLLVRTAANGPQLIDFSGYTSYTTEVVPPRGDKRSNVQWFWESGHFRSELGDLLIRDLFVPNPSIGRVLTSDNIEAHLDEMRRARAAAHHART